MNLPDPKDLNAYVETLFGKDYGDLLHTLAKPMTPQRLKEATPAPWATPSHEPVEL